MHKCISGRDVQKVIPSVVIFRERRAHGGESFVGVVNSQRYKCSSSGTFTAVHIQVRYVSTVNAVGGAFFIFGARLSVGAVHVLNNIVDYKVSSLWAWCKMVLSCHLYNTMFDGVLYCLCFVFTVFLVSLHDD